MMEGRFQEWWYLQCKDSWAMQHDDDGKIKKAFVS